MQASLLASLKGQDWICLTIHFIVPCAVGVGGKKKKKNNEPRVENIEKRGQNWNELNVLKKIKRSNSQTHISTD